MREANLDFWPSQSASQLHAVESACEGKTSRTAQGTHRHVTDKELLLPEDTKFLVVHYAVIDHQYTLAQSFLIANYDIGAYFLKRILCNSSAMFHCSSGREIDSLYENCSLS